MLSPQASHPVPAPARVLPRYYPCTPTLVFPPSPCPCSGSSPRSLRSGAFPVPLPSVPQAPHPVLVPLHVLPCSFQGSGPAPHPTGHGSVTGTGVTPQPRWTLSCEKGKEIGHGAPWTGSGLGRVGDRLQSTSGLVWSTGPLEKPLCGAAGTDTALLLPPAPWCFLSVVGKREQSRHPEQKWPHGCTATAQICTVAWLPLTTAKATTRHVPEGSGTSPSRHCGDVGPSVTGDNFPFGGHTQFWCFCTRGRTGDGQSLSGDTCGAGGTHMAEHRGNLAATKTCHVPLPRDSSW
ncbi:hypothetical protein Nmel_018902 [Mimus melanotis]